MKKLFLPLTLIFLATTIRAQTTHNVAVNNLSFNPADLTIQVGDIVVWTNVAGFHNVDTDPFPDNPESFGNEASSSQWTFTHVFTIPGAYLYHCEIHPGPMLGSINVVDPTLNVNTADKKDVINIYPNPAIDMIRWTFNDGQLPADTYFTLFDLTGKTVAQFKMNNNSFSDISHLNTGIYHYEIKEGVQQIQTGKLLIQSR